MASLGTHLQQTSRTFLLAIGQARRLSLPWRAPKITVIEALQPQLLNPILLRDCLDNLTPTEQAALNALITAGGNLPASLLRRRFGDVRPYRPWQVTALARPWEQPASPLEKLWFFGLIFSQLNPVTGQPDFVIPVDVLPLLPYPAPPPPPLAPLAGWPAPADLLSHDLTLLLALLHRRPLNLLHRQWLPPRFLSAWVAGLAAPPLRPAARSELQTHRRRFIHYLAEAAGLINPPTASGPSPLSLLPAAWGWLEASRSDQLQTLWQAWQTPSPARWQRFRLPGSTWLTQPEQLLAALHATLPRIDATDPAAFTRQLLDQAPPLLHLIPLTVEDPVELLTRLITQLLTGPLTWLGLLTPELRLHQTGLAWLADQPALESPPSARFSVDDIPPTPETITLTLSAGLPAPASQFAALQLAAPDFTLTRTTPGPVHYTLPLTQVSIAQAIRNGGPPAQLLADFRQMCRPPLPAAVNDTLRHWLTTASPATLRPALLLETPNPAVISRLASTRRGAALIQDTLSARAVTVDPARLTALIRRLTAQEGIPPQLWLNPDQPAPTTAAPANLSQAEAALLWVTVKVYQGLGQYLPLPVRLPQPNLDHLLAEAAPLDLAAAEAAAAQLLSALAQLIDGRAPYPSWHQSDLPLEQSRAVIEAALAEGQAVDLHYYSPASDTLTHRVVEPYRLEQHHDTLYIVGFCHHAQAKRTFRLDRIQSIFKVPPPE